MNAVCEPFAAVLRQGREDFNLRFAHARRAFPQLDTAGFSAFLVAAADPVIGAVAAAKPEALFETVSAAYDTALELAGNGLLGPRYAAIEEGWRRILPSAAGLVAAAPNRVFAAVSNALHHLVTTPGAQAADWIATLAAVASKCGGADEFLRVGQVAAWRAGLAHFRDTALAVADSLPEALALGAICARNGVSWREARERLLRDPWDDLDGSTAGRLRLAREAGGFRGFGGLFAEPPRVTVRDGHILVRSGRGCWHLTADAFGATFHRAAPEEFDAARPVALPRKLRLDGGLLVRDRDRLDLRPFGALTSHAATATTLAVTAAHTHTVLLVALT